MVPDMGRNAFRIPPIPTITWPIEPARSVSIGPLAFAIASMNDLNPLLSSPWPRSVMMPCRACSTGAMNGCRDPISFGSRPRPWLMILLTPEVFEETKLFHAPSALIIDRAISRCGPDSAPMYCWYWVMAVFAAFPLVFSAVSYADTAGVTLLIADLATRPNAAAPIPAEVSPAARPPTPTISPDMGASSRPVAAPNPDMAREPIDASALAAPIRSDRPRMLLPLSRARVLSRPSLLASPDFSSAALAASFSSCFSTASFAPAAAVSILTLMSGCSLPSSSAFAVILSSFASESPSSATILSMTFFTIVLAMLTS